MELSIEINSREFEVNYRCYFDGDDLEFDLFAIYKNKIRKININKLSKNNYQFIMELISTSWFKMCEKDRLMLCR